MVSIISVNYNSSDETLDMVKSVRANTKVEYELIIVDNASKDNEVNKLKILENDSDIKLIYSKKNVGFASGNMLGVEKANKDSKYYFFLNNDTLLINNVVDTLYKTLEQNSDIGLASPQLYDENEKRSTTFREFPSVSEKIFGKGFKRFVSLRKIYNNKKEYKDVIDVGIVSGASMFCRAKAFNEIDGLDKNFFLYCEEEDLSQRFHEAGYRVCLEPRAKLIHLSGVSTKRNFLIEREFLISYFYLLTKHLDHLMAFILKLHITLKYLSKINKDVVNKQLFWFCLEFNKDMYSLKHDMNTKYLDFFKSIKEHFKTSTNSIHKARNEIKVVSYNDEEFVIKSFKVPHFINKIVYTFFKDSKAKKSYENSVKIIDFVPKPIGYIEFKKYGLLEDSYFVSKNFKYDLTIREPLLDKNYEDKERIFKEFALFTYKLHERGIFHLDYSPGNILIKKENDSYIFKVVDINRMQFKKLNLSERLLNFSKLWAKDEDLKIIVKEYAKIINEDETMCIEVALDYSQKHKDKKNFKKRLKGQKVVD
ncbi:glycosyltransferase [Sulfurimonas lithotrophica]|uniref:Glycosyltransferase n=1 Tax=Sulfurimonas lithotrophica TaxID=2590022 RepID=A0A5P8NYZ5_9BACT|nr:glycosyltransferase family 2 protein [Sulfurimonas lithotrophica]QFR48665.1 glycosyltransferase [Sulfurimonas lithotrophica]